ncbi:MAG: cysteine desulfurase [Chlorobi bacterium]|nr:cysteine desulfurase [Chlorobiota bacterium]MBX7218050.1 cysteine desulfurase [Candidatus Kapabacteria bacterium]
MPAYLDNSATTPLAPEVIQRMEEVRARTQANASSVHRSGQMARVILEESRQQIAEIIGAEPKEIIFTSGGTEANNLALKGIALRQKADRGVWPTFFVPRTEHHAVLHPAQFLAQIGAPIRMLGVNNEGRTEPQELRDALAEAGGSNACPVVSVMHANNETGTLNPIAELAEITHQAGGVFHTDAVQTFGKLPLNVRDTGVDMATFSAHKIHGPKGIGALYLRKEIELEPLIHGGAQERNRRGGTESPELAAGFATAARLCASQLEQSAALFRQLNNELRELLQSIPDLRIITPANGVLPNIVNATFADAERLDGEGLIVGMDLAGIAVSNGSACASGSQQPSHVLLAMGLPAAQARAAVRFSFSRLTTPHDVQAAAAALREVVQRQRGK